MINGIIDLKFYLILCLLSIQGACRDAYSMVTVQTGFEKVESCPNRTQIIATKTEPNQNNLVIDKTNKDVTLIPPIF